MKRMIPVLTFLLYTASLPAQTSLRSGVSLRSADGDPCPADTFPGARLIDDRVLPDASTQPFAVPEGAVFVATDIVFRVAPLTSLPSSPTRVRLGTPCDIPGPSCMKSWLDAVVPGGTGELRISLQRGMAIAAGTPICVAAFDGNGFTFADLYGYLEQAPPSK